MKMNKIRAKNKEKEPLWKRQFGREDEIKMYLKDTYCEDADWILA